VRGREITLRKRDGGRRNIQITGRGERENQSRVDRSEKINISPRNLKFGDCIIKWETVGQKNSTNRWSVKENRTELILSENKTKRKTEKEGKNICLGKSFLR